MVRWENVAGDLPQCFQLRRPRKLLAVRMHGSADVWMCGCVCADVRMCVCGCADVRKAEDRPLTQKAHNASFSMRSLRSAGVGTSRGQGGGSPAVRSVFVIPSALFRPKHLIGVSLCLFAHSSRFLSLLRSRSVVLEPS